MIKIGDFSKLSRVSIKTLRYYDEMGLLKPVLIDRFTSYRYYEFDQLPRLYRILALKDLGFALEEIGRFLEEQISTTEMQGMLKLRQAEIRQRVEEETERLGRVKQWIRQIEQERMMSSYDVVVKSLEPMRVAALRGVIPQPAAQLVLWTELMGFLDQQQARMIGTPITLYYNEGSPEGDWDTEVCMPIAGELGPHSQIRVADLPEVASAACVVHTGPFAAIGEAYDAIAKWIDQNGYQIAGPLREVNIRTPETPGDQQDANTICEVQFPIVKG